MSMNLDKSLDEILSTRRDTTRRGRGRGSRRGGAAGRKPAAAPTGGVGKNTRSTTRPGPKASAPNGPGSASGESKIIVSNLPPDVNESQIKEYFVKSVGSVKRVTITYGPNGISRGIATIMFAKPGSANDALVKLNGLLVDKRPMKIEVVLDASRAPPPAPVRGMSDRITRPKDQPKQAKASRGENTRGRGERGERGARRGAKAGRGKPKTAQELDAEMTDYFEVGTGADTTAINGSGVATNGGEDLGMDGVS
ncbi:hypothetical protein MMC15_007814 [Xylographa vitiligo]|nr:hypothetical protein [Xylographa vitiligo]